MKGKVWQGWVRAWLAVWLVGAGVAQAQYWYPGTNGSARTMDGAVYYSSIVIDGVTSNWPGGFNMAYPLGGNNLSLIITNGGVLTDSGGYIATNGANSCSVLITGSNSLWQNAGPVYIGGAGSFGRGGFDRLLVTNGGTLQCTSLGLGGLPNSGGNPYNTVTIRGLGSTLIVSNDLFVGRPMGANGADAGNNTFTIDQGATLQTGDQTGVLTIGGANNSVYLASSNVNAHFRVVHIGTSIMTPEKNNLLSVSQGAVVSCDVVVGTYRDAGGNRFILDNGGTLNGSIYIDGPNDSCVINAGATGNCDKVTFTGGTMSINSGSTVSIGSLNMTGGSLTNHGVLNVRGFSLYSGAGVTTWGVNTVGRDIYLDDGRLVTCLTNNVGSVTIRKGSLSVGTLAAPTNSLDMHSLSIIEQGSFNIGNSTLVTCGTMTLNNPSAQARLAFLGMNSTLDISGGTFSSGLDLGAANTFIARTGTFTFKNSGSGAQPNITLGAGSQLLVIEGGDLELNSTMTGGTVTDKGGAITVDGASTLKAFNITLQDQGTMKIAQRSSVGSTVFYLTRSDLSVQDAGSSLSYGQAMFISAGSSLCVSNGAQLSGSGGATVFITGDGNVLTITDTNSTMGVNLNGTIWLGQGGSGNVLVVTNGGTLKTDSYYQGTTNGNNNSALVTGAGSSWQNKFLYVGHSSASNTLTVAAGAKLTDLFGYIGWGTNGNYNSVTIQDAGSAWSNSQLYIGYAGKGNALTVSNGASLVASSGLVLGYTNGASGSLLLDGGTASMLGGLYVATNAAATGSVLAIHGSVVEVGSNLAVGAHGSLVAQDSTLRLVSNATVNATGSLVLSNGVLEFAGKSTNASPFLTGLTIQGATTLKWSDFQGQSGNHVLTNNSLNLALPADTNAVSAIINNAKLTIGGGSGTLYIGSNSTASLMLDNAGQLASGTGYIGYGTNDSGNSVTLTDAGSFWSNSATLFIGYGGKGSSVLISNGASLYVGGVGQVGYLTNSSGSLSLDGGVAQFRGGLLVATNAAATGSVLAVNGGILEVRSNISIGAKGSVRVQDSSTLRLVSNATINATGSLVLSNGVLEYAGMSTNGGMPFKGGITYQDGVSVRWADYNGVFGNHVITNNALNLAYTSGAVSVSAMIINAKLTVGGSTGTVYIGSNNITRLDIVEGGDLINGAGYIGYRTAASNNTVLVSGAGSTWSNGTNLFIGVSGAKNNLTIAGGGQVNNDYGFIGSGTTGSNNSVVVTGAGSVWSNRVDLIVGGDGSGNSLTISDGGKVYSTYNTGTYHYDYIGSNRVSSGNSVLVTDTGSTWRAHFTYVGFAGSNNSLTIANGGVVSDSGFFVGYTNGSSGNSVLVTGVGSAFTNGSFAVGSWGSGNTLIISNGGTVYNSMAGGIIGDNASANSNSVLITGAGSTLNLHGGGMTVGASGSNSFLTVSNGGSVISVAGLSIVQNADGGFGSMIIDGGNGIFRGSLTVATNATTTGALMVANSGLLEIGGTITIGPHATVVVRDGSTFRVVTNVGFSVNGSLMVTNATLEFAGASTNASPFLSGVTVQNGTTLKWSDYNGYGNHSVTGNSLNLVLPSGAGAVNGIVSAAKLTIGGGTGAFYIGSNNVTSLLITNGGVVFNGMGYLGYKAGGSNNTVLVTDAGSVWTNGSDLLVGVAGSGNQLTLLNGGAVVNGNGYIGSNTTASGNSVLVSDAGSVWSNRSDLNVGFYGAGNSLVVSNGGRVYERSVYIGNNASASNNTVTVTGIGSGLTSSSNLFVGYAGSGNTLNLLNGGTASANAAGVVGVAGGSSGTLNVDGGNGLFRGGLFVATNAAATGTVLVSNGGVLEVTSNLNIGARGSVLGQNGGVLRLVSNAAVTVSGSLVLTNATLEFAGTSPSNSPFVAGMTLQDNSTIKWADYNGGMGTHVLTNSSFNLIAPSGAGTLNAIISKAKMTMGGGNGTLYVGSNTLASLQINNGGQLYNGASYIGYGAGTSNNAALVTGSGSLWTNSGDLFVGYASYGNTLAVVNSGTVYNGYGYIGSNVNANGNAATVTGAGSVWSNRNAFYVGASGSGNALLVDNGGALYASNSFIGYASTASSNSALVMSSGSVWSNRTDLKVGATGDGNTLIVADGGKVFDANGTIGDTATANGNSALVTGPGAAWNNRTNLFIGNAGVGNALTLAHSGLVTDVNAYIGYAAGASNNAVLVSDTGTVWNTSSNLYVGYNGANNALIITNGGKVQANNVTIGATASSSNDFVVVTGAGSQLIVTNTAKNGTINVLRGSFTLLNKGYAAADYFFATNGAASQTSLSGGSYAFTNVKITQTNNAPFTISSGIVTLTGLGSFGSTVVIDTAGTLVLSGGGSLGETPISITQGGTLDVSSLPGGYALPVNQVLTNNGTLVGDVTVSSGSKLQGGGSFQGSVTNANGGTVHPGWPAMTQYYSELTLAGGSTNTFDIASSQSHDQIVVTNDLSYLDTPPQLCLNLNGTNENLWSWYANNGHTIVLYDNVGTNASWDGTSQLFQLFDPYGPDNGLLLSNWTTFAADGGSGSLNYFHILYQYDKEGDGSNNDIALVVVPEPSSAGMLVVLSGILFARHRMRRVFRRHGS